MRRAGCELNPREMCALIWRVNVEFIIAATTTKQQTLLALALRTIFTVRIGVLTSQNASCVVCIESARKLCIHFGRQHRNDYFALKLTHQNYGG
jgi:hypothetical protein